MIILKNKKLTLTVTLILFVMITVVSFALPLTRSASFWLGYLFIIAALIICAVISIVAFTHDDLRSRFYGLPLMLVAWYYFLAQLVMSIVQMVIPVFPVRVAVPINIILLGFCLIGLITINVGRDEVGMLDEKIKQKTLFVKTLQSDVETITAQSKSTTLKNELTMLTNKIRFSDPISSMQLVMIEQKINLMIPMLSEAVIKENDAYAHEIINEVTLLIDERNRQCKLLK